MKHAAVAPAPVPPSQGQGSATWALAGLSLAVLLSALNTSIVNAALPTFVEAFGASTQAAQWTVISFVLAITMLIVGAGRLADILGRRRLLLVGIAVFTAAAGLCAVAPSLGWLVAARFIQGAGAAIMMALSLALIGDLSPKGKSGRVMGLLGSMSAAGTALGPALGGLLTSWLGWPAIFLVNLPLGLAALLLLYRYLPPDQKAPRTRSADFDVRGTMLLGFALGFYALALTRHAGGFGTGNVISLGFGLGALLLFVRVQKSSSSPLLRIEIFRNRPLRTGFLMSAFVGAVMMSTLVVGPFYLSRALFVTPGVMGLMLSIGPVVAAAVAGPAGGLVDKIGTHRVSALGLGGAGAGCLVLALVSERHGVAGYLVPVAVMTAGYSFFQTANNTSVMREAAPGERGLISGMLNLSRNLGLLTGASLLGGVFALVAGAPDSHTPNDIALATRATFSAASAFIVAAWLIGVRFVRARGEESALDGIAGR